MVILGAPLILKASDTENKLDQHELLPLQTAATRVATPNQQMTYLAHRYADSVTVTKVGWGVNRWNATIVPTHKHTMTWHYVLFQLGRRMAETSELCAR